MRILVTDGDSRAALAVTRSLGRLGHEVLVGEKRLPSLAQTSRFCSAGVVYPDPARDQDGFVESLANTVHERGVDVLLPVAEIATVLVTENIERFDPACRVPFAEAKAIAWAADKAEVTRTAMQLGLPVPRTCFLERPECLTGMLEDLTFPVVVKPRGSRLRGPECWFNSRVRYAADAAELLREVGGRHPQEFPLLLQERIMGPGMGVFVCYDRGELVAIFSHMRIRERPPSGGESVLSESIEVCPFARRYTELLLGEVGWHGVAMVEFKIDRRDGLPKLMEINGRFWGSLQLAIDAGVDFPAILLQTLDGEAPRPLPAYRVGVRNRWFWGDVDSLFARLFKQGPIDDGERWGRVRALAQFMKLWERNTRYESPRLSDIRPWLYETARRFQRSG
jgi:predicted ATP-grasp superfamily ATP-dependent carboligase